MKLLIKILIILLFPSVLNETRSPLIIFWNVGQGLWTTYVTTSQCFHFDMGGEKLPSLLLLKSLCKNKNNVVYFTHWDWDHINLVSKAQKHLTRLCVQALPQGKANQHKRLYLSRLSLCEISPSRNIKTLYSNPKALNSNSRSTVYIVFNNLLVPGDSTTQEEKIWLRNLTQDIHFLSVGHHGSQTSSSEALLKKIPYLKLAIASCRQKKYGHPHRAAQRRFKDNKIPLITTETWGTIAVEL